MKFNFIANHKKVYCIGLMCQLLKVSRSSYYAYVRGVEKKPSKREQENAVLLQKIKVMFEKNNKRYGSPRVYKKLRQQGELCSLGRVKRLMRQAGLYALNPKKYKPKQEKSEVNETRNLLLEQANKPRH